MRQQYLIAMGFIALSLILVLFALRLFSTGSMLTVNGSPALTPAITRTSGSDASPWLTYKNTAFGFDIKYPGNMKIDTEDNDTTPQSKFVSAEVVQLSSVSPNGSEPSNSLEIDVSIIRTNTTGSSGSYNLERARQDLLQEQTQDPTSGRALVSTLVINGIGALENTSATETGTIQDYQLFPDAKEFVYDISFYDPHGDAALATFSDLIRETVNSFQLLK